VTRLAGHADLVHLHFSFDHLDTPSVRAWLAELRTTGTPLVLTAHDLRNPHHETRERHDRLLAELLPAAAAVLTLTAGAAAEIAARFGVDAVVLPHPSLGDPTRTAHVATEPGLVVLHLKSLRRNLLDPLEIVAAAAEGANRSGGRLRVDVHPEVASSPRLDGLADLAHSTGIELVTHSRFNDLQFEQYLRRAHVTVLPYRWGTHSGWLELARDLGTRVVAPDCGYYPDQWSDVVTYGNNETTGLDPASLAAAVASALQTSPPPPAERSVRLAELTAVRRAHAKIYRQVLATSMPRTTLR
jgi:glycosyltransferase involved in cell wall biosynthesis